MSQASKQATVVRSIAHPPPSLPPSLPLKTWIDDLWWRREGYAGLAPYRILPLLESELAAMAVHALASAYAVVCL